MSTMLTLYTLALSYMSYTKNDRDKLDYIQIRWTKIKAML